MFVTWAALQAALSLWGFRHDAGRRDFGAFLHSALLWRDTGVLYDEIPRINLNPPHASVLLFTPLTWIPFDAAVILWIFVQVSTLCAGIALIARELHIRRRQLESIVPTVVASAMTTHNWIEGQLGGLLLLAGVIAWRTSRRKRPTPALLTLTAMISLKPQLGVLLLAVDWRMKLRAIILGGAALGAGVLLLGTDVWMSWLSATQRRGLQLVPWNVSIAPVFYRFGLGDDVFYLYLAVAGALGGVTWWAVRNDDDADRRWLLWGIVVLLIGPVSWVYYAAVILGPLISWGERYGWPVQAKIAVILWLVPLQLASWAGSTQQGWTRSALGSPYTWGAVLMWCSVVLTTRRMREVLSPEVFVRE